MKDFIFFQFYFQFYHYCFHPFCCLFSARISKITRDKVRKIVFYQYVYCVLLDLCKKKKNRCSSNFSHPINLRARSHFAEPAWSSSRCDWSIAKTFIMTCKGHWPVVYASNLQHIFFARSSLLRTKLHGVVLRVWSRTTLAQAAEVNLLVFITIFLSKTWKVI